MRKETLKFHFDEPCVDITTATELAMCIPCHQVVPQWRHMHVEPATGIRNLATNSSQGKICFFAALGGPHAHFTACSPFNQLSTALCTHAALSFARPALGYFLFRRSSRWHSSPPSQARDCIR
jgi:hypothetical protein